MVKPVAINQTTPTPSQKNISDQTRSSTPPPTFQPNRRHSESDVDCQTCSQLTGLSPEQIQSLIKK